MHLNWKPSNVFYGWWIVGACFITSLYMGGVVVFAFTALFEPIAGEFGWSYTQISFAASLRGMEMGLLAPLLGILVDRWGPRYLMSGGALLLGLGLILLSRTTTLGMFYGAFVLVAFGMSALAPTVTTTAVANWFRRKVSLATGIMISGFGVGGLMVPVVVWLIDDFQWRGTMVILGLGAWAIILPLSFLIRHKPEHYGYLPDGDVSGAVIPDKSLTSAATTRRHIGIRQAIMSRTFWHLTLAFLCQIMILIAVITHVMPYLSSLGIPRSTASLVATVLPLISISGRLGFGWLGDRIDKRWVAAGGLALISLGLLFFGYASAEVIWLLIPFLILFGIGWGGMATSRISLVRELFGRRRYGTVYGTMIGITMLGNISGAPLAGWVFDKWGSYQGIWLVFAGLAIVALVSMVTTPRLRKTKS